MRILYHHRTRAEDAQGIHIEEIQRALRQLGHDVREVALVPRGGATGGHARPGALASLVSRAAARLPRAGYELLELGGNAVEAARVLAAVKRFDPDAIYERYSLHNAAGAIAARVANVPLVLEVNAPLAAERTLHGGLAFPSLAHALEAAIWRAADAVVTVSGPLARAIEAKGVSRSRIIVLPNAVRRELLTEPRERERVRASLGFAPGDVVCGFTGWFRPWHGLETLLDAFADAELASRGARIVLVGDGEARRSLEEIVARRGLGEAVRFTGSVGRAEIADVIAAFDLALQPAATPYASPMKIFEYLALGKPVVAAATPAIAEILSDETDSLLFPVGDTAAMIAAIERLVSDGALRARLSAGARETVRRRGFFWDENARRTLAHLARVRDGRAEVAPA